MTNIEWTEMEQTIRQCPSDKRYKLQPKLEEWIRVMTLNGRPVPAQAHDLNSELRDEAIEAQFDNFPV